MFSHWSNSRFGNVIPVSTPVIPAVCRRESFNPATPGFLTTEFRNDTPVSTPVIPASTPVIPAVCRRESFDPTTPGFLTTEFRNDNTQLFRRRNDYETSDFMNSDESEPPDNRKGCSYKRCLTTVNVVLTQFH